MDVLLARCYGLDRRYYEYIVSSFDHSAQPFVPRLCMAMFDELANIGVEAFKRKYNPYWDIPLNESLPRPVIDLPGVSEVSDDSKFSLSASPATPMRGRRRKT